MNLRFYVEDNRVPKYNDDTSQFPHCWDEERVRKMIAHYAEISDDGAAFEDRTQTVMGLPNELVPAVRELIAKHKA